MATRDIKPYSTEITALLFEVGKRKIVLVEGPSDILFVQALSSALISRKRAGLDPRWTLCPSGGIGNINSFVSLFAGNKMDIAVLTDFSTGDQKKLEDLRRREILKAGRIHTVAEFTNKTEADLEDLFDPALFVKILNAAYSLPTGNCLTAQSLAAAAPNTERQVKHAEAAFNVLPDGIPTYDHFTPAAWLIRNLSILESDDADVTTTLDRAEKMFAVFNAMLA